MLQIGDGEERLSKKRRRKKTGLSVWASVTSLAGSEEKCSQEEKGSLKRGHGKIHRGGTGPTWTLLGDKRKKQQNHVGGRMERKQETHQRTWHP